MLQWLRSLHKKGNLRNGKEVFFPTLSPFTNLECCFIRHFSLDNICPSPCLHHNNHDGMITHLGLDFLECEVKWALGSITTSKASGDDGIPVELFQILEDDAVKVLHSTCQKIWKLSSGHRTGKGQFSFQSQRKAMPKNAQTTAQLHSSYMLVK